MTVRELAERLSGCDPEMPVAIDCEVGSELHYVQGRVHPMVVVEPESGLPLTVLRLGYPGRTDLYEPEHD